MKILNLYAGIGGNRKLWSDEHEVTAVENNKKIAKIYQDFFPKDKVIVCDAHQYLLEHYKEFDFIWSSPPCPTHSRMRHLHHIKETSRPTPYPDMKLWQGIIFLKHWFKGKWVVENVMSYYEPLIKPYISGNHMFWSNFIISKTEKVFRDIRRSGRKEKWSFNISKYDVEQKSLVLNNMVYPELGLYIFKCAFSDIQNKLKG